MLPKCYFHIILSSFKKYTFRLHLCHEEFVDKKFELEISWITEENGFVHEFIPNKLKVKILFL